MREEVLGYIFVRRGVIYQCDELGVTIEADIDAISRPWSSVSAKHGALLTTQGELRRFKTPRQAAHQAVTAWRMEVRRKRPANLTGDLTPAQTAVVASARATWPRRWRRVIQDAWEGREATRLQFRPEELAALDELRQTRGLRWLLAIR